MISNLNILDSVEICVTDKTYQKYYYKTKIQDIGLNNVIYTMIPSSDSGRPVMFFKEQVYELYAKSGEGIWVWKIYYLGIEKVDNISSCKFRAFEGPTSTQRREFFRQNVSLNAELYLSDDKQIPPSKHEGRMVDLSGGGCAVMCSSVFTLHTKLIAKFSFRGIAFEITGEPLDRIDYKNTRAEWDYKYRLKWINANDKVTDMIIKLLFEQQKEELATISARF